jgi:hypothetical protein
VSSTGRDLSLEQFHRLETLGKQYPDAKVIGWHKKDSDGRYGPVVSFGNNVFKFINYTGRLTPGW